MELPEPMYHGPSGPFTRDIVYGYTPDQMRAYGKACARAEREACAAIADQFEDYGDTTISRTIRARQ